MTHAFKLYGAKAPAWLMGRTHELHVDICAVSKELEHLLVAFMAYLATHGVENDPFAQNGFFPPGYGAHATGRTRFQEGEETREGLRWLVEIAEDISREAVGRGIRCYIEVETIMEKTDLPPGMGSVDSATKVFEDLSFSPAGKGGAKVDIHLKWVLGTVPEQVRTALDTLGWYFVRIDATATSPAKEIATLQCTKYSQGLLVFERIMANQGFFRAFQVQLERKERMLASGSDIELPPRIDVELVA